MFLLTISKLNYYKLYCADFRHAIYGYVFVRNKKHAIYFRRKLIRCAGVILRNSTNFDSLRAGITT